MYGEPPSTTSENSSPAAGVGIVITRATVVSSTAIDACGSTESVTSKPTPLRRVIESAAPSAIALKPLTALSAVARLEATAEVVAPVPVFEAIVAPPLGSLSVTFQTSPAWKTSSIVIVCETTVGDGSTVKLPAGSTVTAEVKAADRSRISVEPLVEAV